MECYGSFIFLQHLFYICFFDLENLFFSTPHCFVILIKICIGVRTIFICIVPYREAVVIFFFNREAIAEALREALLMTDEEQIERNEVMQERLQRYNVKRWE